MAQEHYRPLYHSIKLDDQILSIVDQEEAIAKAEDFLQMARELMHSSSAKQQSIDYKITEYLLDATDLGSPEAPYIIALRILSGETGETFLRDEAIVFLKLAAERGHQDACYRMATCYKGSKLFPEILCAGKNYFAGLTAEERELLAEYYFQLV